MKNIMLKTIAVSALFLGGMTLANAEEATMSKAETNAQIKACAKKKQGDWATYGYKGVTFNGVCQPNADGKLQFKAPAP
ncbi:hypothetical protein IAE19_06280 [Acinetobacter sp. S40]|uniref:hypothetical protein n=1 Tax=unclassified Acinetobacter TaxID=196816 RepID=UPI00190B4A4E|nr:MULTISPECIES: hypothetical protein [unclassified Acinetobacter]MBJ9985050.1 hypothetical protein [Acinetobacter sp. S40]MBK0062959.1 hypothetical protein [Acinetobacter sp. S55]MBK0066623.1 hypothetical protein [Acinetobacter sp. S54]